jgi:hypothetical protein
MWSAAGQRGQAGPNQVRRDTWAPAPGSLVPFVAFASGIRARLPLGPLARGFVTTLQASLVLRTGQSPAPSQGRSSSASTPGSHPTPGVLLPRTLASPRTGLAPAGCRELVARLRRALLRWSSAPELLDAHSRRISGRLFFVTMPRRSCGMLSDSRNEWEEAVTAPVRTKRSSPHVRTAVGMFDEHQRQQDARRRQFEVR